MSLTIKELTAIVADATGASKKLSEQVVEALFSKIADTIKDGNEVTIRNFGRFYTKQRAARTARNPKTGAAVQVPAKSVIKFAPRGEMKQ